jgi:hypothetical protein
LKRPIWLQEADSRRRNPRVVEQTSELPPFAAQFIDVGVEEHDQIAVSSLNPLIYSRRESAISLVDDDRCADFSTRGRGKDVSGIIVDHDDVWRVDNSAYLCDRRRD